MMAGVCQIVALFSLLISVCLCASDTGSLNFLVLGDWGGQAYPPYYTEAEKEVAGCMAETAVKIGSQFTMALGDNFYPDGVKDVDDPRFQETFEEVFTAQSLQSRWYVVCGNHDYHGDPAAEVAYTNHSYRWYMPNYYYTEVLTIPGTNSTLQLVMIDTIILAGVSDPVHRNLPPPGPSSQSKAKDELKWIENTLKSSTADWIIMAGHYPVWSIGSHGPTKELVDDIRPLLEKYNVSVYISGHEHDLQYIREENSTVNYFVSGAGHEIDSSEEHKGDIPPGSLQYCYGPDDTSQSKGGYAAISVTTDTMTVTFYDYQGNVLYSTSFGPTRG